MLIYVHFPPIVASRRYALFKKRPPEVSVDAGGGGAKGGTEQVRSFVTFPYGKLP